MVRVSRIAAMIGALGMLLPFDRLSAGPSERIVDLIPAASRPPEMERHLERALAKDVTLTPLPPELIARVQAMEPSSAAPLCDASAPDLPSLISLAREQLLLLQTAAALTTLERARQVLPCVPEVLPAEWVRDLFLLQAVAHLYGRDQVAAAVAMADVASVAGAPTFPSGYNPQVRQLFDSATQQALATPARLLSAEGAPGEAFVDGAPIGSVPALLPGRHVFQLRLGEGSVRTTLVRVDADAQPLAVVALPGLGIRPTEQTSASLALNLSQANLTPWQQAAVVDYLRAAGESSLSWVFLTPSGELALGTFDPNGGFSHPDLSDSQRPAPPSTRPPPPEGLAGRLALGAEAGWSGVTSPGEWIPAQRALGAGVSLELSAAGWVVGAQAVGLPWVVWPEQVTSACPGGECLCAEVSTPSGEQVTICGLQDQGPLRASLGVGRSTPVGSGRLSLVPQVGVEGRYLPQVIYGDVEGWSSASRVYVGPRLSAGLRWRLMPGGTMDVGLDVSAAWLASRAQGEAPWMSPAAVTLWLGRAL